MASSRCTPTSTASRSFGDRWGAGGQSALTESDRWILSRLNSLIQARRHELRGLRAHHRRTCHPGLRGGGPQQLVRAPEPTPFLERRSGRDKNAAFQTLHRCLEVVAMLSAPIAPFFSDRLYRDLTGKSVHLSNWPKHDERAIDTELEQRTRLAQSSPRLVLSIRKKEGHRVRQPLQKMMVPV
jgi:isoleucyl-tRNA synthetase